jgi:putative nucleotidyltransferase with HDIG domain
VGGVILLLLLTPSIPLDELHPLAAYIGLTLVFGIVDAWRIELPYEAENSVSMSVGFGMVLLFGTGFTCWAVAVACCLVDVYLRKPWYKALFNAANAVLSFGLAGWAYRALYDPDTFFLGSARNIGSLALAMVICLAVNTLNVSVIIAMVSGSSPWRIWSANYKGVLVQLVTLAPLGSLIALAYSLTPYGFGLILLFLPLGAVYYSLKNYQELRDQTRYTIGALAKAVDRRDPYTFQHSQRVMKYAAQLAERLDLPPAEVESVVWTASIHDLGKIDVPDRVLTKPTGLDDEEWGIMRQHPAVGAEIVARLSFHPSAKDMILHHHEWFDGSGYPSGIKGDDIPIGARIVTVVDAFEAMTSDRPYRLALSYSEAVAELEAGKGTQFDPKVVDAFVTLLEEESALEFDIIPADEGT